MEYKKLSDVYVDFEYLNSDIQLEKGALLLNNNTGEVIAQLRFSNYSSSKLKSLYIAVEKYDDTGALLDAGNRTQFAYLDLNISKNQTFGDDVAVVLDNALTRNIKVYLIKYKRDEEVINVENVEIYDYGEEKSQIKILATEYAELFDKYYPDIKTSYTKICYPLDLGNNWFCSCGKFNHNSDVCVYCGLDKNNQLEILTRQNAYMLSDREKKRVDKAKEISKIKRKKQKKINLIIIGTLVLFIGICMIFNIIRFSEYKKDEVIYNNSENLTDDKRKVIVNYSKLHKGEDSSEIECRIVDITDKPIYNIVVVISIYDSSGNELPEKIEQTIDKINANDYVIIKKEITNNPSMGNKVSAIIKSYDEKQ